MFQECSKHGAVMHSYVESRQPGGLVYVMFSTTGAAMVSGTESNRVASTMPEVAVLQVS